MVTLGSKTRLCILFCLFCLAIPTFAHDGELHPDDLDYIVSGIGIIAILITGFYVYWSQQKRR